MKAIVNTFFALDFLLYKNMVVASDEGHDSFMGRTAIILFDRYEFWQVSAESVEVFVEKV